MKTKLLTLIAASLVLITIKVNAQTPTYTPAPLGAPVFFDGFETWAGTPLQPTVWMKTPTTNITNTLVTQSVTTPTTLAAEQGTYACNLKNTTTTYSYMATAPNYSVTAGMGYEISYYARGKGTIAVGVATGTVNTSPGGESVSGKTWHQYKQSVVAPTTTTNAAFFIKVHSTGTYSAGGVSITGIDVDSFCVRPYTLVPNVDLYSLQYTTASNGNSPFYGQAVGLTGGIVTGIQIGASGPQGYYIQTSGALSWAAMSVYDYVNSGVVHVGDSVTFGGTIDELYGMTQMSNITNFTDVTVINGHSYVQNSLPLTTTTINQEMYEAMLVNIQGATVNSYTASYGQATITDASGVPCIADLKDGFYAPNGNATSGSSGLPGYVPTVNNVYCFTGNVYYTFGYNIEPRDSADIKNNCTQTTGVAQVAGINSQVTVYPNPAATSLQVSFAGNNDGSTILITDMLGNTVKQVSGINNQISINVADLSEGIYFLNINTANGTVIKKFVVQQ